MTKLDYSSLPDDSDAGKLEHPASLSWVVFTFFFSIVISIAAQQSFWMPNFLALTIIFWTLRQPESAGMTVAFCCGILMDVLNGSVLGQQALAFVTLCYFTTTLARRISWFGLSDKASTFCRSCCFRKYLSCLFVSGLTDSGPAGSGSCRA